MNLFNQTQTKTLKYGVGFYTHFNTMQTHRETAVYGARPLHIQICIYFFKEKQTKTLKYGVGDSPPPPPPIQCKHTDRYQYMAHGKKMRWMVRGRVLCVSLWFSLNIVYFLNESGGVKFYIVTFYDIGISVDKYSLWVTNVIKLGSSNW